MSKIVYRITDLLCRILVPVPVGTNLGLFHLFWALLSGRFLQSRGAVVSALHNLQLPDDAVRRCQAALTYGHFQIAQLLDAWYKTLRQDGHFLDHCYEGIRPVACDLSGFFRPRLAHCFGKHYAAGANKALPAIVLGLIASVGSVGKQRLAALRLLLRQEVAESEARLQKRLLARLKTLLTSDEAAILDAGFELAEVLAAGLSHFVLRGATNFTARRNTLPAYKGRGCRPKYGEYVRPLSRRYKDHEIAATPPDATARWKDGRYRIRACVFDNLVLCEARPGSASFRCVVIFDPRYKEALVLLSDLAVSAQALWCLYRDRWPIEQLPLAAKQMLGAERAFVFGKESRFRLPELALLAGNVLSYEAACNEPIATGFWDRRARATCGRLRRALARFDFSDLALPVAQLRKKASVTKHLPMGVEGHRRRKAVAMDVKTARTA